MVNEQQLEAFLSVKSAYQTKVMPKSNTITFLSNETGMSQIWRLNEEGEAVRYGELHDVVRNYYHSPNGDCTIAEVDTDGNEKNQLYLIEESGNKITPLVVEPEYFHEFGGWSPDGQKISFSSNRRHPGFFDVFIMDLATGEINTVFENDGNCTPLSWLSDGEHILLEFPTTNIDSEIYKLNIASGDLVRIGVENKDARYKSLALKPGHEEGFMLTDIDAETMYVAYFSMDKPNELIKVTHDVKWDMEELKLSPNGEKFLYTLNEAGFSRLILCDTVSSEVKEIPGLLRGVVSSLAWVSDDEFVFAMKSPKCPGDIWKYNLNSEQLKRITFFSENQEIEHLWVDPETRIFTSFDGRGIPYLYYGKVEGSNKPAVIYVHGGPENQTKGEYYGGIQYLVSQGFAVVTPNIRGSNGYGRTYIKLDDRRKRMDAVRDLAALNKHLAEAHQVDPKRIGIYGISYGGYMTLSSITHFPELWKVAVDLVGMSNLRTFLEETGPWRRKLRSSEYGTLEEDTTYFDEIAPLNLAENVQTPLLVFHGQNDSRVPINESEQMVNKLKELGKEVEYIVFPNEGHVTHKVENKVREYSELVKFMIHHLTK